jgi:stage II sporulation protein D
VRIGLATDLERVTLPCCDGEVAAEAGTTRLEIVSPVTVQPAARTAGASAYRVQLAALRDDEQAAELARRLTTKSGERADVRFDAQTGLYRVRLGRFPTREGAEAAGRALSRHGVDAYWIVSEGVGLADPALEVQQRGRRYRIEGRRFALEAPPAGGLRVEGRRYRGKLVVFLNDRGRLNLVNELPLEDYLRGVVPRELGPGAYPELEALKAQAVAARTYTLRNLGEFADEGYDLCGTPRCQVYGGMDDEHPLSDRAIAETAGEVLLYRGEPIDALYSATCGGHTEDVRTVFPLKSGPYLRGVPCIEAGLERLHAAADPDARFPATLVRRVVASAPATIASATDLEGVLRALARTAGFEPAADRLAALDRREVFRFLASAYDLALDAQLFVRPEELAYLVSEPPPGWSAEELRFAAWLTKSGLLRPAAGPERLSADEIEQLLFQLALRLGVIEERRMTFSALRDGALVARDGETDERFPIGPGLLAFHAEGAGARSGELVLAAGDALRVYTAGARPLALVQEVDARGAGFDREHKLSSWTRFRSDAEIAASVRSRFPGFAFAGFDVLTRGVSGRVGSIRLNGATGETLEVAGLAVRWTLELPDTLFTARRLTPARGPAGWQFTGRGWGHGVGLCQVGGYGMARRGHDYRSILTHYYSGVTLTKLAPAIAPAPRPAAQRPK